MRSNIELNDIRCSRIQSKFEMWSELVTGFIKNCKAKSNLSIVGSHSCRPRWLWKMAELSCAEPNSYNWQAEERYKIHINLTLQRTTKNSSRAGFELASSGF